MRDAPSKTGEAEPFVKPGIGYWHSERKKALSESYSTSSSSGEQAQCFQDAEQEEGFGGGGG